jgi:hypothetical protein
MCVNDDVQRTAVRAVACKAIGARCTLPRFGCSGTNDLAALTWRAVRFDAERSKAQSPGGGAFGDRVDRRHDKLAEPFRVGMPAPLVGVSRPTRRTRNERVPNRRRNGHRVAVRSEPHALPLADGSEVDSLSVRPSLECKIDRTGRMADIHVASVASAVRASAADRQRPNLA